MRESEMHASFWFGPDAEVRTVGFDGEPPLGVYNGRFGITMHPTAGAVPGLGDAEVARRFADAACDFATAVDARAGDPEAGAEFWASIDTCPDDCGCHR